MKTRHLAVAPEPKIPRKLLASEKKAIVVTGGGSFSSMQKVFSRILGMHYGPTSQVLQYEEFLARPDKVKADVLFLRSSKFFPHMTERLKAAIDVFRQNNPGCRIAVTLLDTTLQPRFQEMKIDVLETRWIDEGQFLKDLGSQ